jgi:steroid delta-isomerase-like uncharacterized protein
MNELKDFERRYYAAFNRRDFDSYGEYFADDVEVRAPGDFVAHGLEAMTEFDRGWVSAFPDAAIEVELQAADERAVISENHFTGTHEGILQAPAGDIPATGRSVDARYVAILEVEGGKCRRFRCHYDQLGLLEQLGLMPSAAAV